MLLGNSATCLELEFGMRDKSRPSDYEDDEITLSSKEELADWLEQNPDVAIKIVRALAEQFSDTYTISEVLDKGYEDAADILDLFSEDMETEALASTPYIDSATDWGTPFEESFHFEWSGVCSGDVVLDEHLESDFSDALFASCLALIEEKGTTEANSTFVDIFGTKVLEAYKCLLSEKLRSRQNVRENEDKERQEKRDKENDAIDWVFEEKQLTLFPVRRQVPHFEALCRLCRVVSNSVNSEYQQNELAWELENRILQSTIDDFSFQTQEFLDAVQMSHQHDELSTFLDKVESARDGLYQVSQQWSCSDFGERELRELALSILKRDREDEDNSLAEDREEEDRELAQEAFSEAVSDAHSPIADWIKATIELNGSSLLSDSFKRM